MANIYKFSSPEEMRHTVINNETDLYCPDAGIYVFHYNNDNAVAMYYLSQAEAEKLAKEAKDTGEYWGAFLGPGGRIYDGSDEFFEAYYNYGTWVDTDDYLEYKNNLLEENTMNKLDVIKKAAIEATLCEDVTVTVTDENRVVLTIPGRKIVPSFRNYDALPENEDKLYKLVYDSIVNAPDVDEAKLMDKDYILDNLVVKLGQDDLNKYVGEKYLDMSKTYYYDALKASGIDGRIHITNDILNSVGLTLDDLKAAEKKPVADIKDMATIFMGKGVDIPGDDYLMGQMNVGMAKGEPYGATLLLYPELIQKEMDKAGIKKAAIIPSSIYEVLILDTAQFGEDDEAYSTMIGEVNSQPDLVGKEEILSTHPYYIEDGKISYAG